MAVSGICTAPSSGSLGLFEFFFFFFFCKKLGLSQQESVPLLCGHESKSRQLLALQCPLGTFQALAVVLRDISVSMLTVAAR